MTRVKFPRVELSFSHVRSESCIIVCLAEVRLVTLNESLNVSEMVSFVTARVATNPVSTSDMFNPVESCKEEQKMLIYVPEHTYLICM